MESVRTIKAVTLEVKAHIEHWRGAKLLWEWHGGDYIGSRGLDLLANRIGTADRGALAGTYRVRYLRASAIGTSTAAKGTPQGKGLGSVVYHGTAPFVKTANKGSFTMNRSFSIGSTYAIRESGLFVGTKKDATLRGTLYCRGTFPVRNVASGDTITLNYTGGFISG